MEWSCKNFIIILIVASITVISLYSITAKLVIGDVIKISPKGNASCTLDNSKNVINMEHSSAGTAAIVVLAVAAFCCSLPTIALLIVKPLINRRSRPAQLALSENCRTRQELEIRDSASNRLAIAALTHELALHNSSTVDPLVHNPVPPTASEEPV